MCTHCIWRLFASFPTRGNSENPRIWPHRWDLRGPWPDLRWGGSLCREQNQMVKTCCYENRKESSKETKAFLHLASVFLHFWEENRELILKPCKSRTCFFNKSVYELSETLTKRTWRTEMPSRTISSSKTRMDSDTDVISLVISSIFCIIARRLCSSSAASAAIWASSSAWRKEWSLLNSSRVRLSTNRAWIWNEIGVRTAWKQHCDLHI